MRDTSKFINDDNRRDVFERYSQIKDCFGANGERAIAVVRHEASLERFAASVKEACPENFQKLLANPLHLKRLRTAIGNLVESTVRRYLTDNTIAADQEGRSPAPLVLLADRLEPAGDFIKLSDLHTDRIPQDTDALSELVPIAHPVHLHINTKAILRGVFASAIADESPEDAVVPGIENDMLTELVSAVGEIEDAQKFEFLIQAKIYGGSLARLVLRELIPETSEGEIISFSWREHQGLSMSELIASSSEALQTRLEFWSEIDPDFEDALSPGEQAAGRDYLTLMTEVQREEILKLSSQKIAPYQNPLADWSASVNYTDLYDRAHLEHTLSQTPVEKRIAFGVISKFAERARTYDFDTAYELAEDGLDGKLARSRERLARFVRLMPTVIPPQQAELELIARHTYYKKAIYNHKTAIQTFFNS